MMITPCKQLFIVPEGAEMFVSSNAFETVTRVREVKHENGASLVRNIRYPRNVPIREVLADGSTVCNGGK